MALDKVTVGVLADNAVTSSKIADGTVVTADIQDGSITPKKMKEEGSNIIQSGIKRSTHKAWVFGY